MNNKIQKYTFTFIDLFAGIGGIRIAFERAGGKCIFSSEYDPHSQKTYKSFFGENPDFSNIYHTDPPGDITKIPPQRIPAHNILTGGFPCQPFSLAGVSKKMSLGRPHGFDDLTQGTLFFNIKEIIKEKQPSAFLLENVKNLKSHDHGNTFDVITSTLTGLGYTIFYNVIDAGWWTPQHRERIYIIGFKKRIGNQKWEIKDFPEFMNIKLPKRRANTLSQILENNVPDRYTLGPNTWATLERHKAHHESIGQGFGYSLIHPPFDDKTTRTLSARYHKDGAEILIYQEGKRPRRLTPLECCRLMGFPGECEKYFDRSGNFPQPVSDTQAYRQFGNSVSVPVVTEIAQLIIDKMKIIGALK
jgi:DNA (cytosine-5)-methyltransferase 1